MAAATADDGSVAHQVASGSGSWSDSGVEGIRPGVNRIPLPMPSDGLRAVNVYAIVGRDEVVLVDGGWRVEPALRALESALRTLGADVSDVRRCLVTHLHRDHYSLAVEVRARWRASLSLGEGERPSLVAGSDPHRRPLAAQVEQLTRAGAADLVDDVLRTTPTGFDPRDYEAPDTWLEDGQRLTLDDRVLRVLATPGHTAGHVVFVDDENDLMFAGDHVLPHITPSIGFEVVASRAPLTDYLRSLAAVLEEPDRTLLPAHGPAGGSVHSRVGELLEHHADRLDRTADAVAAGSGTGLETARSLRWTRSRRSFDDLDAYNRMLAVLETTAHLEVLRSQGRVRLHETEGVDVYLC